MRNTVPNSVLEIANKASKIPFVKKLLKPFYYRYKNRFKEKRNLAFKENALALLEDFDRCMADINVEYSLAYGSMLGAVREHGFIKHDLDLDVFIWIDDFSDKIHKVLTDNGFKLEHRFLVEDGKLGREETYSKNDVSIDIFYVYAAIDKYPYACSFYPYGDAVTWEQSLRKYGRLLAQRWDTPISREYIDVDFEGIKVKITSNFEEFLCFTYGKDYMIPDPNFKSEDSKDHYVDWPEVFATVINE